MKIFTCKDFDGHYPVGTAAVIVAKNEVEGRYNFQEALKSIGLKATGKETFVKLYPIMPIVRIFCDGNY